MQDSSPPLVAHVIYRLDVGGLENGLANLLNCMPVERFRHAIVCLAGVNDAFRSRIRRLDVRVLSIDKRPGKDPAAYARMWRTFRCLRPMIVHTRNLGTVDMQWVAALAGVPHRVHGEHGWEASDPAGQSARSLRIRRACRPVVERYVTMSKDLSGWLERDVGVRRERISQIYSGVDGERFHPGGARPADLPWYVDRESGRDPQVSVPLVIGTVGRLDPVKNQAALLYAVHRMLERRPELRQRLRLIIAGDGPLRDSLEALTQELGLARQTWFAGSRSDIPDIMRAIDVFALPSLNEGISNTILEAMATGLPVVATRVGGNLELIVDGMTGALYAPGDDPAGATGGATSGLEQALLAYVEDPAVRQAHGEAGRARVLGRFSLEAMVRGYLMLYDDLLSAPARGRG